MPTHGEPAAPHSHPDPSGPRASPPELKWALPLPAGWEEVAPGEMRVASFRIQDGSKQAEMGVVPLPGLMGRDLESVNRWRGAVGLAAVTEEELPKLAEKIEIAGQQADLYEQAGENPGSGDRTRILAAINRRQGVAWFFKFTGDDEIVAKNKPAFVSMLKSLAFVGGAAPTESAGAGLPPSHPPVGDPNLTLQTANATGGTEGKPSWEVPANWKEAPAGQFLVAKFMVTGAENAQAAINVSMSAGAGGGLAGNINRWRGQLGMGELTETEIGKLVSPLETPAGKALVVDMSGTDARSGQKARLIGAVLSRDGVTWFYKLMGDEQVVESQKTIFSNFVRSAKYN